MAFISIILWLSVFFVFYTYLGYPFLIMILARLRPGHNDFKEYVPLVTILIPAFNEEKYIAEKLDNTLALDYPADKLQILVAADGSFDTTPEIVKSYAARGVELNYIPDRNGKMAAIVRAMQFSRGEIVVFSDANNMYDRRTIRELVLPFSDPKVGATTGAKLIIDDGRDLSAAEGLYWKYESAIKTFESKIDSCVSSVGELLAVRKDIFVAPKGKIINDDHYIILDLLRRGHRLIYTPAARSYEYVSKTAKDEIIRRRRMNAGLYQTIGMSSKLLPFHRPLLIWQILSHKYFRAFVPFAMIAAFATNLILVLVPYLNSAIPQIGKSYFYYLALLGGQIIFYLMALIGNKVKFRGLLGKLFYLPTFLVNSNLATLAGLYTYLTDSQPHIWNRVQR